MLKKIFKYEWKTISPLLLGVHGVGLVIAIFSRIGIELMGGLDNDAELIAIMLLLAAITAIGCIAAYTHIYGGYRFYKSVFTQQGYLTNTLPVTADQLIWGKGFTVILWSVLDFLWVFLAAMIVVLSPEEAWEFLSELPGAITGLFRSSMPLFSRLIALAVILSPFCAVMQLYVSAAIGNLFTGHKLLATVGAYLGIGFIQQIAGLVIMAVSAPHLSVLDERITAAMDAATSFMNLMMGLALLFSILCTVAFYFLCRYVLNRKLNLE